MSNLFQLLPVSIEVPFGWGSVRLPQGAARIFRRYARVDAGGSTPVRYL